jgi:hypothetical protein
MAEFPGPEINGTLIIAPFLGEARPNEQYIVCK